MDATEIIRKMNEYLYRLNERLGAWLAGKLPQITDQWWQELVWSNLTYWQRKNAEKHSVTAMDGLDLAATLRVLDRNWFVIRSRFFLNDKERTRVRAMQTIRNTWAHIAPDAITQAGVARDAQTVLDLLQAFGASMQDTSDIERFILDVEDEGIEQEKGGAAPQPPAAAQMPAAPAAEDIRVGSMVCLVSDASQVGAVTAVDGNRYTVFLGMEMKTFYREQIRLMQPPAQHRYASLPDVRSALTAYQIHHPGARNLYSLNAARIDFVPFQFRPALKLIQADSPRLLVADDVGVGKTIEAGLILKEMEARRGDVSTLVVCPRPLVAERKWQLEMKRFDEDFTQLDGRELAECIAETDRDGEWPERHAKTVMPYSLFSEDTIQGTASRSGRKRKNIGLAQLDPLPHFDLVIVDEAHNIRNPNTWAYRGVELFCRNADAVIFLTATPLQNSNDDLYTLLNLLRPDMVVDKDTFVTMSEPNRYVNELSRIVRRMEDGWQAQGKEAVAKLLGTSWGRNVIQHSPAFERVFAFMEQERPTREARMDALADIERLHSFHTLINRTRRRDIEDFCVRKTQTLDVPFSPAQQLLYDDLIDFENRALVRLHGGRSARFLMCTLMRQASSCIYGLAPFLDDLVARRLSELQTDGGFCDYDEDLLVDDELLSLRELAQEIRTLAQRLPEEDPKFDRMLEVVRRKQDEENSRVIVFSSFRHTLHYVREKLAAAGLRVGQVDGSVPDEERYRLRQRFLLDKAEPDALDVLLFSEVGCEGLDYQFCDTMINYDLPWNPMRIEQRIGRIDRRGQESDTVRIYNLITEGTIDATIYARCLSKIGIFEASIGDCSEILGEISDKIMKIMLAPDLTEEERKEKLSQMADNEIRREQELRRLEREERSLYGFDLAPYTMDKDVQAAENAWIHPGSMEALLRAYLDDVLGAGDYLLGKGARKTLRIAQDKRQMLLKALDVQAGGSHNQAYKRWKAYLKSGSPTLTVTFDHQLAKEEPGITFLTQMHPLIAQAAACEDKGLPADIAICGADTGLPAGDYAFLIYAWQYIGLRPDIKLVPVCAAEDAEDALLTALQYASPYDAAGGDHEAAWKTLDAQHYERWRTAVAGYKEDVRAECEYRQEQLRLSWHQQEAILKAQFAAAGEGRIRRMRAAQLENRRSQYEKQKTQWKTIASQADIHANVLVRGILHVDG